MEKKQAKELVRKIFGDESANDNDIVDFYLEVNKDTMQEYADEQSVAFAEWLRDSPEYRNDFSNGIKTTTELLIIFINENK